MLTNKSPRRKSQPRLARFVCALFMLSLLAACTQPSAIPTVNVTINNAGVITNVTAEIGTTVQSILASQNITLTQFDKVNPDLFSVVTEAATINVTRVEEIFETEEVIVPYEQQTVRNESLPEAQTIMVQSGVNGVREITYRNLYENGSLISRSVVRQINTVEAKPEIIMVGVQSPFSTVPINGKIAYLSAGNAWVMESDSANRRPVVTTGDVDGRIFSISPNADWLLYTRSSSDDALINELWAVNLDDIDARPVYLDTDNVIHFAEWMPGFALGVLVSTVEKRSVAPGWQANNNLLRLTLGAGGRVLNREEILESNSGGIYGWWGATFRFSPNGRSLAFSRPDSVGIVDLENNELVVLKETVPFQTRSEWAWVSPISWSPDSQFIYYVDHQSDPSYANPETSPFFDLKSINISTGQVLNGPKNVGMFSYTSSSPIRNNRFQIIYLQAIFPENSETSRYRVMIMDRDGSNARNLYPAEGSQGLEPQEIIWEPCNEQTFCQAGLLYQGNIWLIDLQTNSSIQLTGDGLISRFSWK